MWLPWLITMFGCTSPPPPAPAPAPWTAPAPISWPDTDTPMLAPVLEVPEGYTPKRIYIDAGHGARGNAGNVGSYCQSEGDFTLRVGQDLATRLRATGQFEVRTSRDIGELVSYQARVGEADAWGADAFISLHSDVRGTSYAWAPEPGLSCPSSEEVPGFTVLWSDAGSSDLQAARLHLARQVATQLSDAGFGVCDCGGYWPDYEQDDEHQAVWVDRHKPGGRIYVLRRPTMPSIIIETHNAWDTRDVDRWDEERTLDHFGRALTAALFTL
jgi:N-acetylmuramoyl-L-alanine amidase